jgi:hypothetical protein
MRLRTRRRLRRLHERLKLLWENDERRIRRKFRGELGREPDLDQPLTLNEKILWLNLRHRDPRWIECSDKVAVRDFVRDQIGEAYLVPLLGIYDDADDIDLETLPDSFIIKAAHGSGWNLIVRDKRELEWSAAKRTLQEWLSRSYYSHKREWQYRDVPHRIVIEELLLDADGEIPDDYKVWCLRNGAEETVFLQVDMDRFTDHRRNYYDLDWIRLPFEKVDAPGSPIDPPRPEGLGEMVEAARKLSEGFCLVRVDFYSLPGRIYFGEMMFTPDAGMARFEPEEWDRRLGDLVGLPGSP